LIEQPAYSPADKARMIQLLVQLDIYRVTNGIMRRHRTPTPQWAWLRANRGSFDVEHTDTGIEIVANGRGDWVGWLELATEPVDETSTRMTAQVIHDVAADIQAVVEAEDRPSLDRFNTDLLASQYGHVMLIDGNDTRGIDVDILTSPQVEILSMRSNVDVPDPGAAGEHLFSRDCAQYQCRLLSGATVWVLVNHFKSQSGGGGPKRARQAQGVRTIVQDLVAAGERHIVVMGDLNEGPTVLGQPAANLATLVDPNGPLVEVYVLPTFIRGHGPAPSRAVGSATASTTSWSPTTWPDWSSAAASNDAGCGEPRPTSTPRPTGTSTPRSPTLIRQPPTTPPSTSTSTSDRSRGAVGVEVAPIGRPSGRGGEPCG
jgi:hypothetical protein